MDCADVLKEGVFQLVKIKSFEHSVSEFYEFIMNASEAEARQATTAGIDLSIPVEGVIVPLKGNFDNTQWNAWSQKRQRLVKSDLTKTLIIDSFSRVGDKEIVQAWSKCMSEYFESQAKKNNLFLDVSRHGNLIPVIVELRVAGSPVVTANITDWSVVNGTLQSGVEPTLLTAMEAVQVVYERVDTQKEMVISIQTTRGPLFKVIPPEPKPVLHTVGQDSGAANPTKAVTVTVDFDQVIRVWGGCVAAYEQAGDPMSIMWLFENKVGNHPPAVQSPWVYMVGPNAEGLLPLVHIHGIPYRGTVVKEFDFKVPLKAGETRTYIGFVENDNAYALGFPIYIDYLKMPGVGPA